MVVYFNNDLTPCNGEKDGIETRVYMCNELNPVVRNNDCIASYPEAGVNATTWKLIPESCTDPYEPEDGNETPVCGNVGVGLNWFN